MMMSEGVPFKLLGEDLLLLPQKAIYWPKQNSFIIADVHLGKTGHFRKAGIAIPRDLEQNDLAILSDLVAEFKPERIVFLGDLFHSDLNADWEWFTMWRQQFPHIVIDLIKGNHDIIADTHYTQLNVNLYKQLVIGPFLMLHHPLPEDELQLIKHYVLCGHIHPGINLTGKGRQSITLPCFAFGAGQAILPSFGKFTGKVALSTAKTDKIFAVLKDKVVCV